MRAEGFQGSCRLGCGMVPTKAYKNTDLQNLPSNFPWLEVGKKEE